MTVEERYYLDANTVIAIVEGGYTLNAAQRSFLENVDAGRVFAASSEIALAECLVKPFRILDATAISSILEFLNGRRTLPLVPLSRGVMIKAAQVRAVTDAKMPDAIHIACAADAECTVFLSSDKRLRVPAPMRRIGFDELVPH
ncbi:type II toxin-antitoxin system VapC family toxin [Aurantimonas sp. A2-1-M11]|uniref:type II toxin-antitoxin system VapC family toxin n=1 Tax=Aurantimonas sp. A2-1-M11 TaxID=3113712 RepID=UPI002F925707